MIDATHDLVCAYKPQIAFYSAVGAERELEKTIEYIRQRAPHAIVILDAKRGDVGNTAAAYAREAFERYGADAVTVNAYTGGTACGRSSPTPARGAIVLCRTSNPGARDLQDLQVDGRPLYQHVAERAARDWNEHRQRLPGGRRDLPRGDGRPAAGPPRLPFLVPGIGTQGGDLEGVLPAALDTRRAGPIHLARRGRSCSPARPRRSEGPPRTSATRSTR